MADVKRMKRQLKVNWSLDQLVLNESQKVLKNMANALE